MIKIVNLSKGKDRNIRIIEATFSKDGVLVPLRVNEDDRPEVFNEINKMLESKSSNMTEFAKELFTLMSPEAKVQEQISSSYYLSGSLGIKGGHIYFGKNRLEETLSNHMMSLLDGENTPKDEKMWRSYVKFLDNLYQNADEDIRTQLFRWMDYENKAGNEFGITEDGCIVGYKGCQGTILEPTSVFTGNAIVDGVEFNGNIPNRVGSVVQMPRSAVQVDPAVGCSQGLHVGTRDYATKWAPVLLLVKVNPRDIVSVPYECDSQKMRVCEYTVLNVTDTEAEHKVYHENEVDEDYNDSDYALSAKAAFSLLGCELSVEYNEEFIAEGELIDVFGDGIVLETSDGRIEIELSSIDDYSVKSYSNENLVMDLDTARELLSDEEEVVVNYEGKTFTGYVVDVYEAPRKDPGVIMKNDDGEYKHIKLFRIESWNLLNGGSEDEFVMDMSDARQFMTHADELVVDYEGKTFVGIVVDLYEEEGKDPGIIMKNDDGEYKHIKLYRIESWSIVDNPDGSDEFDPSELFILSLEVEENLEGENSKYKTCGTDEEDDFEQVNSLEPGTHVTVVYAGKKPGKLKAFLGTVVETSNSEMTITVEDEDGVSKVIPYTALHSIQVLQ